MDPYEQYLADIEYEDYLKQIEAEDVSGAMQRSVPQDSPTQAGLKSLAGGFGNLLEGLTLGSADEIIGGGAGFLDYIGEGFDKPLMEYINPRMAQSEQLRGQFKEANPVTGFATEAVGAMNNPLTLTRFFGPASSTVGRIAQEAGTGALQGTIAGASQNQDRLENAARGFSVGGALGAAGGALSEGVSALPGIGKRLQRAAFGLRQSDIKKAAKDIGRGQPNPLVTAFENLQEEGVLTGGASPVPDDASFIAKAKSKVGDLWDTVTTDKSSAAVQERLAERAKGLNQRLQEVLSPEGGTTPLSSPLFVKTKETLKELKGTDFNDASRIFDDEVSALRSTLDEGGSLSDWQKAKKSLQGNTKYGTESSAIRNTIRKSIASDIRAHIENVADTALPATTAGEVRGLNQKLSEGLRMDEVLERGKTADLARDPEASVRGLMRTSGGYGVPMILAAGAGGAEYKRSGSTANAVKAALVGGALGTRTGKYALGAAFKAAPKLLAPELATRALTPFVVRQLAKTSAARKETPPAPIDYFKAGPEGVEVFKAFAGDDVSSLDDLYREATLNYKNFAAPNGTIDQGKSRKWLANNKNALEQLPELRAQLSTPENAQRLIERHFPNNEPISQSQIDTNALREYIGVEPSEFVVNVFQGKRPVEDFRQTLAYLRSDREASAGLRRSVISHLNSTGTYPQLRDTLEKGGVFTQSQIKVADYLYGLKNDSINDSTLKAISQMATGSFLGVARYSQYVDLLDPIVRNTPPEVLRAKIEHALTDPLIARDLMNKANAKNVTRSLNVLFKDEIANAFAGEPTSPPPPPVKATVPKQDRVTSGKSFPTPGELLKPPTAGELRKSSFNVKDYISQQSPETQARISVESSGNPEAVSPKGAQGLSQLMPETAQEIATELGEVYMPLQPGMTPEMRQASIEQNVRFGDYYYKKQLKRFKSPTLAWAAYNAGPRRVVEAMALAGTSRDTNKILSNLPKGVRKETIPYVDKIAQKYGMG